MIFGTAIEELGALLEEFGEDVKSFSLSIRTNQKYKDILVGYNIENLKKGIRPDGTEISKYPTGNQSSEGYEAETIRRKKAKGRQYNHVDLYDTGAFYEALSAVSGSDTLYLKDSDPKAEIIREIWGDVIGITEEQREEFFQILYEDWLQIQSKLSERV